MSNHQKGFTLVELLVVMSVVSFLASTMVTSFNGAKDRARISRGLEFDAANYHSFGSDEVARLSFNNGTPLALISNPMLESGANITPNFASCNSGCNIFYSAANDTPSGTGLSASYQAVLSSPSAIRFNKQVNLTNFTVSVWVEPSASDSTGQIAILDGVCSTCSNPTDSLIKLTLLAGTGPATSYNQIQYGDVTNNFTVNANIQRGKWSNITYSLRTWLSGGSTLSEYTLYLDGVKIDTRTLAPNTAFPNGNMIDKLNVGIQGSNIIGNISDVSLYQHSLTGQ